MTRQILAPKLVIAMCEPHEDLPFDQFIACMAERFAERTKETVDGWLSYARDCLNGWLETEKIKFGDPENDWCKAAAHEYADEDMSYWEG